MLQEWNLRLLLLVQAKSELIFPSLYFSADIGPAQKNKATSYHLGQLKAKLAKLRRELIQGTGGSGRRRRRYWFRCSEVRSRLLNFTMFVHHYHRTGIASVGFVGFPSVGKVSCTILIISNKSDVWRCYSSIQSTLMSKLTGTHSEVSEIDFTTLTTVPGTLKVHGGTDTDSWSSYVHFARLIADYLPSHSSWYHWRCQWRSWSRQTRQLYFVNIIFRFSLILILVIAGADLPSDPSSTDCDQ